jgi:hypothetical protein
MGPLDYFYLPIFPPLLTPEELAKLEEEARRNDWTHDQVREVLPKLRNMSSIENAWLDIERDCLVVRTARGRLKHPNAFFPLAQVDIRIPLKGRRIGSTPRPKFKYVRGELARQFHTHPTMGRRRIGGSDFEFYCIGEYFGDYEQAHKQGVYETVIVLLTMLQTIKHEHPPVRRNLPKLLVVFLLAYIGLIIYFMFKLK